MKDLIILGGAPGSGKSTIGELLREQQGFPLIEFGWLRQGHLNNQWSNASDEEEQMAFENLIFIFIINNYWKRGYKNIIVTDLQEDAIKTLAETFKDKKYKIISLVISDDEELKKRVLGERDSGFRNVQEATEWNRELIERESLPSETKIDNTHNDPVVTVQKILEII